MTGIYCEVFGNTLRNRVVETLLIGDEAGVFVPYLAEDAGISKPRAYEIIYEFEKKGYMKKHRKIGKIQLWILNEKNSVVKLWKASLKDCMKLVAEEYKEKHPETAKSVKPITAK